MSQYTGEFQPDAQVYGCCRLICNALICSSFSAKCFGVLITAQTYAKSIILQTSGMDFAQKIYINNKPLILTTNAKAYIAEHPIAGGYIHFIGAFPRHFRLSVDHINKPGTLGAIIEDEFEKSLTEELHNIYTPIDAGGGVVKNEKGEVLMIYRRGKWDLPKGKRDDGEKIDECAIREVSEETGLEKLKLGDKICDTYHVYAQKGQKLLKRTAWYNMTGTSKEQPTPQEEENIEEVRWIAQNELAPFAYRSYEAIREVMQQAGVKW